MNTLPSIQLSNWLSVFRLSLLWINGWFSDYATVEFSRN